MVHNQNSEPVSLTWHWANIKWLILAMIDVKHLVWTQKFLTWQLELLTNKCGLRQTENWFECVRSRSRSNQIKQTGRDPSWSNYRPNMVCLCLTVVEILELFEKITKSLNHENHVKLRCHIADFHQDLTTDQILWT